MFNSVFLKVCIVIRVIIVLCASGFNVTSLFFLSTFLLNNFLAYFLHNESFSAIALLTRLLQFCVTPLDVLTRTPRTTYNTENGGVVATTAAVATPPADIDRNGCCATSQIRRRHHTCSFKTVTLRSFISRLTSF